MRSRGFTFEELIPEGSPPGSLVSLTYFQMGYLQAIKDYLSFHYKKNIIIKVTSGYRAEDINREVGGAKNSNHIYRLDEGYIRCANDIIPLNANTDEVFKLLEPFKGEIYQNKDKGIIHIGQNGKAIKNHWVQ